MATSKIESNLSKYYVNINSSSTKLSTQSDVISWFSTKGALLPKYVLVGIRVYYSGWDTCHGYVIRTDSNDYKIFMINGGGRLMFVHIRNNALSMNKYIDMPNSQ